MAMSTTFSTTLTISQSNDSLSSNSADDTTICAGQLINESLEGLSGRLLWGIIQIILMILGDIGNILTLIVLNRRLMRKGAVNHLLQGLAVSDIVAPTLACIPHMIYYYGPRTDDKLMKFVNLYIMPLATGATFCSNWIVVTITCFRLMVVVKPLYSQVYCSSCNEKRVLIAIFLVSILSILPYYYYQSHPDAQNVLRVVSAALSLLGPWVICVILWILLIRIVNREIGSKKSEQFILHSEIVAQRLKSKSKITKMVLIICFCNIICQLPVLILTLLGLINGNPCGYRFAIFFVCLLFTSNLLLIVNHSINFFIYSLTNSKFRYTLKIMCRHCSIFCHPRQPKRKIVTIQYDEQRKPSHRPKCEYNSCSNSKNDESPRLTILLHTKNTLRDQQVNNKCVSL